MTLASKKQGGKGLGLGAVIVSVLGGVAWIGAISLALLFVGLDAAANNSAAPESTPSASAEATPDTDEDAEEEAEEPSGTYDEAAYLAEVRPQVLALMQEIEPTVTEEMLATIYTDETLLTLGTSLVQSDEATRDLFVQSLASGTEGLFTEEQAQRFFDIILVAAEAHLQ